MSAPVPPAEVIGRRLRSCSVEARAAFVAELFANRGWTFEREGSVLVGHREGRTRRIAVGMPSRETDADTVLMPPPGDRWLPTASVRTRVAERRARNAGAELLGPSALRDRLAYGMDADTAAALLAEHLDLQAGTGASQSRSVGPRVGWRAVVAAIAVVVLIAGAGAAAMGGIFQPGQGTDGDGYPPGVSADGLESVDALVEAHLEAFGPADGMTMNATFAGPRFLTGFDTFRSGFDDDDEVTVRVRVASPNRYVITRRTEFPGGLVEGTRAVLERFADGETEYRVVENADGRRFDRRALSDVRGGRAEIEGWTRSVFQRYLATNESRLDRLGNGTPPRYRLVVTGEPYRLDHGTRGYRAVALVAADGFVTRLEVSYTHPRTGTSVRITVRYGRSGIEVRAPPWYGEAKNRTG